MQWRKAIEDAFELRESSSSYRCKPGFSPAATAAELEDAQASLNVKFPESLRAVLLESNGAGELMSIDRGDWMPISWLVWPIEKIVSENVRLRSAPLEDYEPLDASRWLFFSTAGVDGIYFAHPRLDDDSCSLEVFAWNSFERRDYVLAACLEDFLIGWVSGTIHV